MNARKLHPTWARGALLILIAGSAHTIAFADDLTPAQLQQQLRAATFEVVLPKPDHDPLTYERPLPLDQLPAAQRNDRYWSIGSAVAIGPNQFVTAAHVLSAGAGGQFALPAIRDDAGHVYVINQVLKYSSHEDFAEFSVRGAPPIAPLGTSNASEVNQQVFAAGSVPGEGTVIRTGTLESKTPEEQDGRWSWLGFSSPSPGSSGGPLIDVHGNVIGIVIGRSGKQGLNVALPIERILKDDGHAAAIEMKQSLSLPFLHESATAPFKGSFPLPLGFAAFAQHLRTTNLSAYQQAERKLLTEQAASIFPKGDSAQVLAELDFEYQPALLTQADDRAWQVHPEPTNDDTQLADGGEVSSGTDKNLTFFKIRRAAGTAPPAFYSDPRQFIEVLLNSLKLSRPVGTEQVRITSLGVAQHDTLVHDHYGRVWQLRAWPLGFTDLYLVTLALPTPDGYAGITQVVPSSTLDLAFAQLSSIANYFYLTYTGTAAQWAEFMQRRSLRPQAFEHVNIDFTPGMDFHYQSNQLNVTVPSTLVPTSANSMLDLDMTYLKSHGTTVWDVGGLQLAKDPDSSIFVRIQGQPQPQTGAGKELFDRWDHMTQRSGDFDGAAQHGGGTSWFHLVVAPPHAAPQSLPQSDDPAAKTLYEVTYSVDKPLMPQQELDAARQSLLSDIKVVEHKATPPVASEPAPTP